jgi:uncharacterized membrane protein required for colicin V production
VTALAYENLFDLLVLLLLVTAFIIGYLQGTVRRLLGIASVLFALVLSAQLRGPVGDFLGRNWTQFPSEYSQMLGWGLTFLVLWIAFGIAIQIYYERSKILPRHPYVDPIVGGLLGVVEGGLLIGVLVLILDSYFRAAGLVVNPSEFLTLRDLDHAIDVSQTARIYRETLIPGLLFFIGALIPAEVRALFPPH